MNALVLLAVGVMGATGIVWVLHLRRLKRHYGLSRSEFVEHFRSRTVAPEIAEAVYNHFQKVGVWKDFRPGPSDTLEGTYKIVDEDVEDAISDIVRTLGYEMPHSGILKDWESPLSTLEEVVGFVDWVRTHQSGDFLV